MGKTIRSMFIRRGNEIEYVCAGSTFQRVHADDLIETAKVLSVASNPHGIPHVKYLVSFRRRDRNAFDEGSRMLALKAFAELYKERVTA